MKKHFPLLLALLLIVPMLTLTLPARADGTITVHAQVPTDWTDPCIYSWPTGGDGELPWPGTAMTHEGGQWYVATISATVDNLIINDLGAPQTRDLGFDLGYSELWVVVGAASNDGKYDGTIYYSEDDAQLPSDSTDVPDDEPVEDIAPGDPYGTFAVPSSLAIVGTGIPDVEAWDPSDPAGDMTKITSLIYEKELFFPEDTEMTFKFTGNDFWDDTCNLGSGAPVIGGDTELTNSSESTDMYLSVSGGTALRFTVDMTSLASGTGPATLSIRQIPTSDDTVTVHAQIPADWGTEPHCWPWRGISENAFEAWPGEPMSLKDGWYTIQVPAWIDHLIINDGGPTQTYDLAVEPGKDVWLIVRSFDDVSIHYQEPTDQFTAPDALTIVGSGIPGIREWDPTDPNGEMTQISSLLFEKEIFFLEAAQIAFRFAGDDTCDLSAAAPVIGGKVDLTNSSSASDMRLEVPGGTTLLFTVDLSPLARGIGPATLTIEQLAGTNITIHAQIPDDWGTGPHCWVWDSGSMQIAFETWPGEPMTMDDGWYTIQAPAWIDSVIINDGNSAQTPDLSVDPGKDIWLVIRDHIDITIHYEDPTDLVTYYARFPADWQGIPHCWAWDSATQQAVSTWPGTPMESAGGQWYSIQLPDWADRAVFSDENGLSSQDIALVPDQELWIDILSTTDHTLYPTDPGDLFTVYAHVPADWGSSIYCRALDAAGQSCFLDLTGKQMVLEDGWYHVQVPAGTCKVQFFDADTSSSQLSVTSGQSVWIWFDDTSDYTISETGPAAPDVPTEDPTTPSQNDPPQDEEENEEDDGSDSPGILPIVIVILISIIVLAAAAVIIIIILKKK